MDALNVLSNLASPTQGDVSGSIGSGATMAQRSNPGVVATLDPLQTAPQVNNPFGMGGGNPVVSWVAVLVLLLGLKFAAEHGAEPNEFASVRFGFYSFFVITVTAILGINAAKWFVSQWHVPGVSALVLAS